MKLDRLEVLAERGSFRASRTWAEVQRQVVDAIGTVAWPQRSRAFTIFPAPLGNGVKPIKLAFIKTLQRKYGWTPEVRISLGNRRAPGKIDAVLDTSDGLCAVEWETGNVSSSHRALNKMALGLLRGQLTAGVLVVPTRALSAFLTDRVGNFEELEPYFDLWRAVSFTNGALAVAAVEHDATSRRVSRIPKGTDGRALV